jgi:hypothetical protein
MMRRIKDLVTVLPLLLLTACSMPSSIAQTPPAATPPAAVVPEPPTPFDLGRTDIAGWIDEVAARQERERLGLRQERFVKHN